MNRLKIGGNNWCHSSNNAIALTAGDFLNYSDRDKYTEFRCDR
ncbi:hypothetical protein APA_4287 [Pseudanabaena sp. lw0831]|nr:hypothetical protein APA_4287 [Pseudanabaena sp. lw0831]